MSHNCIYEFSYIFEIHIVCFSTKLHGCTGCVQNELSNLEKSGIQECYIFYFHAGSMTALNREMNRAIQAKNALRLFSADGISNTGTRSVNDVEVTTSYPLVSAITMIAPSPDWFVGVHDYNLCNETNGKWFEKKVKGLFLYDSGTDDAPTFVHINTPSKPPVPIFLITNKHEGSLKSNNTIKSFGTFTFEKTFDSQANDARRVIYANIGLLKITVLGVFMMFWC